MKERQRRFADEYLIDLNAEAAAVRAGYSPRYARGNAYKLVARSGIKEYIAKRMAEKERLKAAELLGKRYALFTDKVETDVDMDLNITIDYGE